jgi:hypothetical protein
VRSGSCEPCYHYLLVSERCGAVGVHLKVPSSQSSVMSACLGQSPAETKPAQPRNDAKVEVLVLASAMESQSPPPSSQRGRFRPQIRDVLRYQAIIHGRDVLH